MKIKIEKEILDTMRKDPGNWKGPFYYNRKDPGLIVPKIYPLLGWTVNFTSPYAWILFICIVLIIVLSQFILK